MPYEYAIIHLFSNVPWALGVTALSWPFMTRLDWAKLCTIIGVAIGATMPWDSYLIRKEIFSYNPSALFGYRILLVPVEDVFFFAFQTYNTGMLYVMLTRHLVFPSFLRQVSTINRALGMTFLVAFTVAGIFCIWHGGRYTYLGFILAWACPVLSLQWLLAGDFIVQLPVQTLVISVTLPTLFLWAVDIFALQQGSWVIQVGTKLDWQIWGKLDIEEALFFLLTNMMIVFGVSVSDFAIALTHGRLASSPGTIKAPPSYKNILYDFVRLPHTLDDDFVACIDESVCRLAVSSQSMYIGSAMFQGPLRIDLIMLYSFCRIADDLVDEAGDRKKASDVLDQCALELESRFASKRDCVKQGHSKYPELTQAINNLPATRLRIEPLQSLLEGFRTDLRFDSKSNSFPIHSEQDLDNYAYQVAGTVAASMIELLVHHFPCYTHATNDTVRHETLAAAETMGRALQLVNIARDIERDIAIGRVYIPTTWLEQEGITPADVIRGQHTGSVDRLRERVLIKAQEYHDRSVPALATLPVELQGPLRAVIENYMEIGAALKRGHRSGSVKKLQLSFWRRLLVTYRAMMA
ncbi:Lycopene beta-cyclase [Aspergillus vadensis CBS 113365]|uniref:Bifunctional lycopene cyclase/phytoene synthase n=1 Tax=Aspergillus vadensis (strain CBS 113365 / IMI 142717 / IBT 24658) TaxID=1448311 RepID=A0A319BFY5_ASPVC|nr:Lycopene beta-cyclase [Aspergillus vadensis CBS 113365]PYH70974.1 Lycopene beta-cyclase [Aspergillus vadensis CBS 113365]